MTVETQDYRFCPQCFEAYPLPTDKCPEHKIPLVRLRYPEGSLKGRLIDGKYVILDLLGRGGMGVVYRARQMPIKREVAFKVLNREFLKHPASVKRFIQEASAASMLRSRFSAIVHDFGLAREGFLYFTMEVARGNLLSDAIRGETPLEIDQACLVASDICRSIEEAHGFGIVHRDLKPGNIMLSQGEDRILAKVLDFGTARRLETRGPDRITDPGKVFGTPEYMSPEQAMGEEVGPTADIYSLGVMLYEMLTGALPFAGKTHTHILLKQIKETPRPLRVAVPERDIPEKLDTLVGAMLQKSPKKRPQSAREVRHALSEILHESFPHAWEPSPTATATAMPRVVGSAPGDPTATRVAFGALTPEIIGKEEQKENDGGRKTLLLGQTLPMPGESDEFILDPPHPADVVTRRSIPQRGNPKSTAGSSPKRRHSVLPAAAVLLLFGVLVAGGWRVAEVILDGRSTIAPKVQREAVDAVTMDNFPDIAPAPTRAPLRAQAAMTAAKTKPAATQDRVTSPRLRIGPMHRNSNPGESPDNTMEGFFLEAAAVEDSGLKPLPQKQEQEQEQEQEQDNSGLKPVPQSEPVPVRKPPPRAADPGFSMDDLQ